MLTESVVTIDPQRVKPFAEQPRKRFRGIAALAGSIAAVGQTTPILVTRCKDDGYDAELIDGERRLRACRQLGCDVRAIFQRSGSRGRFAASVAANFCRQPHDPMEIANAIRRFRSEGMEMRAIGDVFGRTEAWVYQHLSLLKLSPFVQGLLEREAEIQGRSAKRRAGRMTTALALLLVRFPPDKQDAIARSIVEKALSFKAAREEINRAMKSAGIRMAPRTEAKRRQGAVLSCFQASLEIFRTALGRASAELLADAAGMDRRRLVADIRETAAALDRLAVELTTVKGKG